LDFNFQPKPELGTWAPWDMGYGSEEWGGELGFEINNSINTDGTAHNTVPAKKIKKKAVRFQSLLFEFECKGRREHRGVYNYRYSDPGNRNCLRLKIILYLQLSTVEAPVDVSGFNSSSTPQP
jgi:hypothetical protein